MRTHKERFPDLIIQKSFKNYPFFFFKFKNILICTILSDMQFYKRNYGIILK